MHLIDDALGNLLVFIRDDENCLAVIEACNDLIHHRRIDEHIDEGEHRRCHAEQKRCDEHDKAVH